MADLNAILSTLQDVLKAPAAAANVQAVTVIAIVRSLTGENPVVSQYADHVEISFTPSQQEKLKAHFENLLTGKPGAVRIKAGPILYPVILSRLIPLIIIAGGVGFIIGKKIK